MSSAAGARAGVGAFEDDPRPDAVRVALVDHLLERARGEHVAVEQQELVVRDRSALAELPDLAPLPRVTDRTRHVEAARAVTAPRGVGQRDDDRAELGGDPGEARADGAESLHGHAPPLEGPS